MLALLVAAEERAKRYYMEYESVDGGELGWVGRDRRAALKENWATAQALRELYENQPPDEAAAITGDMGYSSKASKRKPMR